MLLLLSVLLLAAVGPVLAGAPVGPIDNRVAVLHVDDGVLFYTLFELLLLLVYGMLVRAVLAIRGIHAVLLLSGYTVLGSSMLLIGIVLLWVICGSSSASYSSCWATTPSLLSCYP